MPDDELDELYAAKPEGFTALRSKLTDAANQRGDASTAKAISAARKPTTAAWIVNQLVQQDKTTRQRLSRLGDRLRAAHGAMDGEQIRSLSTEQHQLTEELTRAAFDKAGLKNPSASVREDVTATLQAAIADPHVAAKLGRLTKAERWSGFGGFGTAEPQTAPSKTTRKSTDAAARRQLEKLQAAWTDAEQAKTEADRALSNREEELTAARLAYERAKQASRAATEAAREAKQRLKRHR